LLLVISKMFVIYILLHYFSDTFHRLHMVLFTCYTPCYISCSYTPLSWSCHSYYYNKDDVKNMFFPPTELYNFVVCKPKKKKILVISEFYFLLLRNFIILLFVNLNVERCWPNLLHQNTHPTWYQSKYSFILFERNVSLLSKWLVILSTKL
jgi:hypothetical protein